MSVYKRKGTSLYSYEFEFHGVRHRGPTGKTTEREARAVERQAKADARQAVSVASRLTVRGVLERYWTEVAQHAANHKTLHTYVARIAALLGPDRPFAEIGGDAVTEMTSRLLEAGFAPGTVQNHVFVLRAAHGRAGELWEMAVKPIAWRRIGIKRPAPQHVVLTHDQARKLLANLPQQTALFIGFLLATGMRLEQARSLTWQQIDRHGRRCTIRRQKQKQTGKLHVIPLTEQAMNVLAAAWQTNRDGLVFDTRNFRRHWSGALTAAGLTGVRIHDLRHTFATWLGQSGTPIETVSKLLGHSSLQITMRYREVFESESRDHVARFPTVHDFDIVGTHVEPHETSKPPKTLGFLDCSVVETPRLGHAQKDDKQHDESA